MDSGSVGVPRDSGYVDAMEVTPKQAAEMLDREDVSLIDVREDYEHAAGHIAGDRHIPLRSLAEAAGQLDRDKPIVFYCRAGARSLMAAQAFAGAGFQAYSLEGGALAWAAADLPFEGEVADH